MFGFLRFNKKIAKEVTKTSQEIIKEVSPVVDAMVEESKNQKPIPKTNRRTYIEFTGWADKTVKRGVLLDNRKLQDSTVNIVLVTHESNHRTKPYIKWINESYCTTIKAYDVSHIDSSNFNPKNWDLSGGVRIK